MSQAKLRVWRLLAEQPLQLAHLVATPVPIAQAAARIASRILDGEAASKIPVVRGDFTRPAFDWRQLQRFGISESRLPAGSEIRFLPPGLWDQYHWHAMAALAVVLLQAAMITWLLFERRRRQTAQLESRRHLMEVIHLNRTATAGALSASVGHELNQPLGAILSNTEAAETFLTMNPPDMRQLRDILADIRRDDQRASDIIRHLRGLLKKGEIELQTFDLNDAIGDAIHILEPEAMKRGVVLSAAQGQGTSDKESGQWRWPPLFGHPPSIPGASGYQPGSERDNIKNSRDRVHVDNTPSPSYGHSSLVGFTGSKSRSRAPG
jgi:signal transduction histidine kinase